ncbi:MAG: response regulator [Xanthomonadaceae bacterium]|nr:response regulator [Xanthomonadaceae bacterium]MDP2184251.1 response regulator [Xanthomonadales bacterium]MDZ4114797.1 response regulator [Xanthomonadaceae bacterium]MDZ4377416.1 response regulator [Xanthomonadaceae bacterium]
MEHNSEHILIVDDDPDLSQRLARYLEEQGYSVALAGDGEQMFAQMAVRRPDLLLLDLMLPGEDGLSLARRLRADQWVPIIMLSARGEDVDRIVGLEVGADDYLAKPFNPRELLARIRAVLRRRSGPTTHLPPARQTYAFGPFRLDPIGHRITRNGAEVTLTSAEFSLLRLFNEHPNQVLSRDRLIDLLKGYDRSPFDRSVDVRVTRLRRKIEVDPTVPQFIRTIWGEGYLFAPDGGQQP